MRAASRLKALASHLWAMKIAHEKPVVRDAAFEKNLAGRGVQVTDLGRIGRNNWMLYIGPKIALEQYAKSIGIDPSASNVYFRAIG